MFKQRLLTALVLVPIVLLAIYYAHPRLLGLVVFMMLLTAGWEWSRLMPIISMPNKVIFMMLVIAISGLSLFFLNQWLVFGLIVWAGILLSVLTFPASKTYWGHPIVVGLVCLILLPLLASSLVALYQLPQGKDLLVYFLCLVWAADIGYRWRGGARTLGGFYRLSVFFTRLSGELVCYRALHHTHFDIRGFIHQHIKTSL